MTKRVVTYDGGWFYPQDPYYYTVDKKPAEQEQESEDVRKVRLYREALEKGSQLQFCYNGGSRPGEVRTVRPLRSATQYNFKAQENGVMKTYLYSLITDMQIVQ